MNPPQRKYALNVVLIGLALGWATLLAIFFFKVLTIDALALAEIKQNLIFLEAQKDHFDRLRKEKLSSAASLEAVEGIFAGSDAPVALITFLEDAFESAGYSIKISPGAAARVKNDVWPSMLFQVSGRGQPQKFLQLLEKVDNIPFLAGVVGLDAKVEKEALNLNLTIKAFVR